MLAESLSSRISTAGTIGGAGSRPRSWRPASPFPCQPPNHVSPAPPNGTFIGVSPGPARVSASQAVSETGRAVREYRLTAGGRKQLEAERAKYRRLALAIAAVLETA